MEINFSLKTKDKDSPFFKSIMMLCIVIGVVICVFFLTWNKYKVTTIFEKGKIEAAPTYSNPQNELDM